MRWFSRWEFLQEESVPIEQDLMRSCIGVAVGMVAGPIIYSILAQDSLMKNGSLSLIFAELSAMIGGAIAGFWIMACVLAPLLAIVGMVQRERHRRAWLRLTWFAFDPTTVDEVLCTVVCASSKETGCQSTVDLRVSRVLHERFMSAHAIACKLGCLPYASTPRGYLHPPLLRYAFSFRYPMR